MTPRRIAGAPISWGVCEVPGWGRQLPPERVFSEMASLGLGATELGPVGYLPLDAGDLRRRLEAFGLQLIGGFVPLVLQEPNADAARERADEMAQLFAAAGADVFVAALVADEEWSRPPEAPLDTPAWERLVDHLAEVEALVRDYGLQLAVHPHAGTLIERDDAIQRLLADSTVGWCLDTGHLLIGGTDPIQFVLQHAERIVHVHLKDVDAELAMRLRAGEMSLLQATQEGLFRPLGQGDARISEVLQALDDAQYEGWLVLEQDTAITGEEPPAGEGPIVGVADSLDFLRACGYVTRRDNP